MAQNTPAQQLSDMLVTRGYDPEMLDSTGRPASSAEDAEIFSFEFISSEGTNYGTVVIMLSDDKELQLFSGDNVGRGMDSEDKTEWYEFQHQLKNFATKNFMTFGSQNINRLKYSMQGQAALKEGLFESWNGTKNVSWNAGPDAVRLMIRHKRPMGVNEARFRQVESLFVETAEGERYKLPFRNLAGGRAMIEHVRQGGKPYDMRGQHIANIVEELNVLSRFRRASHGKVFEGDTASLVNETNAYYATASKTLKGLASSRGYNTYFESWNPADVTEQDLIIENIKTLFVEQTIDSRIEQALPILARIQQQGTAMKEANIFETWANRLVEGTWATPDTPEQQQKLIALLSQELPVGADATNATEQLYDLVGDDILFDQLADLADQDANADCRSVVVTRIKQMADKGFNDFVPVLDALKSTQLAPQQVAPAVPVAEEISAEAMYDPRDDDSHDYGTDLLVTIRRLYVSARDGKDPSEQFVSLNRMKDGIEQSQEPRFIQSYNFLIKNLAGGAVTDPKMIMQIADKAHQMFHPSLEPIAQATREAVGDEEYSVDGGMNNKLLQDGMDESLKEELQADDGEYYESADDFFGQFEAESFDNEETSPDGMEVRGYIDGVNVMVWRYDDESMTGGYGYYDDSAMQEGVLGGMNNELLQDNEEPYVTTGNPPLEETFQDELNDLKRLLGEGWKGEMTGGTIGGIAGNLAGSALVGPVGGIVGGAVGSTAGGIAGRELTKEEQLNEIAPLLAAGARAIMPLLARVGPALGRMASTAGKAGAEVAGKTATGIGRGTADVAKSAAQSAAQNAGKVGLGVGAYQAITDVANGVMGGVGEVYRDAGQAAGAIAKAVGNAIDEKTIIELAGAAVKYAIPIGMLLAVVYGGKKLIDKVMAEGLVGAAIGGALAGATGGPTLAPLGAFAGNAIGDTLGSPTSNKGSQAHVIETLTMQGQYGHSGKLQNFDDVEQDVLQRLRELSGMIRS